MKPIYPASCTKRQAGAVLVASLIFLIVLTLLGVTSARMSSLEERISGNIRDRELAMQAAEMSLRDAERDIVKNARNDSSSIRKITSTTADCGVSTEALEDDGLCNRGGGMPTYTINTITWPPFSAVSGNYDALVVDMSVAAAPSVAYGTFTDAEAIDKLSVQPRYIIEAFRKNVPGSSGLQNVYRITVRSQGRNPNTVVWLQEIFKYP